MGSTLKRCASLKEVEYSEAQSKVPHTREADRLRPLQQANVAMPDRRNLAQRSELSPEVGPLLMLQQLSFVRSNIRSRILVGGAIAEGAMRSAVVQVSRSDFGVSPGIGETRGPVLIQALVSEASVEVLVEEILDRVARADEVERDAVLIGSGV